VRGRLHPDDEAAIAETCEALRDHVAALAPGQWFELRLGREQSGRITPRSVVIKPPQIFPVKGNKTRQ